MKCEWRICQPPPEQESYLVQTKNGHMSIQRWTRDSWVTGEETDKWDWYNQDSYDPIVAWRPLPRPYDDSVSRIGVINEILHGESVKSISELEDKIVRAEAEDSHLELYLRGILNAILIIGGYEE